VDGARASILRHESNVRDGLPPPEFRRIARDRIRRGNAGSSRRWLTWRPRTLGEYHFAGIRRWTGISPKQWLQQLSLTAAAGARRPAVRAAAIDAGLSGWAVCDLFVTLEAVTLTNTCRGAWPDAVVQDCAIALRRGIIVRPGRGVAFSRLPTGAFDGFDDFHAMWRDAVEAGRCRGEQIADTIWHTIGRRPQLTLWVHGNSSAGVARCWRPARTGR
jgi:hypothetical protein